MRPKGTMIQGALAVIGLGAAYATWQREPDKGATEVVVLEAKKSDVARVRFEDDKGSVELWRGDKSDGDEPTAWVKISAREERGQKVPEREVRGNEASLRLLDSFAPLKASRALGQISDTAKLKEYGLAPPDPPAVPDGGAAPAGLTQPAFKKRTIAVTARGDTRSFLVGTPPGLFATYIRDERDSHVYLLGGSLIGDLESASTRMVDRTLHGFKGGEYDALTVESGGKKRDLVVTGDLPNTTKFASAKSPDKPDETLKNWHEKLFRVFPSDVLGKGEKPAGGEPQVVLKVAYAQKSKGKGFLEVAKVVIPAPPAPATPPPPAEKVNPHAPPPPPAGPTTEYWARTEHTAGWVKLGFGTDDLVKEAEKIAATE